MKQLLDFDPNTGISHQFSYDNETDMATITAEQDISKYVESNKKSYNDSNTKFGEWDRVASIPMVVYLDLKKRGILDDQTELKRWLNDPDNRYFRTRPGTI